jgi:hypothetical protein
MKRDLNIIVPEAIRQIPPLWNDETKPGPEYFSYHAFTKEHEIEPNGIENQRLSKNYRTYETPCGKHTIYPKWATSDELLHRMFSILGLWHGPMNAKFVAKHMPGLLQGGPDGEFVEERVKNVQRAIEMQYNKMIDEVIKPITMSVRWP